MDDAFVKANIRGNGPTQCRSLDELRPRADDSMDCLGLDHDSQVFKAIKIVGESVPNSGPRAYAFLSSHAVKATANAASLIDDIHID
ncbi:hypothetical protein GCM10007853_25800 [Algimonas ampicilliniresistens]|uniref:Uncharacterized protein n=1 Tax=Algimonas ampicilliniresistens TaxID=1298735 RepID=A0ABQ5VB13_9PROT|nr:hypothetical protein GCM10007853_25800 [Algimonas ampicilliniresistens]